MRYFFSYLYDYFVEDFQKIDFRSVWKAIKYILWALLIVYALGICMFTPDVFWAVIIFLILLVLSPVLCWIIEKSFKFVFYMFFG